MNEGDSMGNEKRVMMEKKFIFEFVDEDGNYIKSESREIEQLGFYIRCMALQFCPCVACQKRLIKEMHDSKQWSIGNKDTDPPVELWRKFEIDDNAWKQIEKHKATKEEKERFKDGFGETTYL
jgi:hypothetical protein